VIVREFRSEDWPRVWPFLHTIIAAGETYCWPTDATESDARTWWMHGPRGRVFVAEDTDGGILGTAELHPNQAGGGAHVANAGFMVDPAASGRGIGRALAVHTIDAAQADGFRAMQFNAVVATNVAAVHLWESLGFRIMTTIPGAFAHPTEGYVGLHVMYRELE
jgi:ribosomal protein S18 acetylase RimI-like enzyme